MSDHERQFKASAAAQGAAPAPAEAPEGTRERSQAGWQEKPTAAADPPSEGPRLTPLEVFEVECLNSARYHEDREQFFSLVNKWALFFIVASGTASLSPLKADYPVVLPALTTLAGLLNLVFDISGKARLHAGLKREVYSILAETKVSDDLPLLQKRLVLVYAEEPPPMYAVSAVAYNGAMASRDRPEKYFIKISTWARFWRHLWPYAANSFKTYEELGR